MNRAFGPRSRHATIPELPTAMRHSSPRHERCRTDESRHWRSRASRSQRERLQVFHDVPFAHEADRLVAHLTRGEVEQCGDRWNTVPLGERGLVVHINLGDFYAVDV